MDLRLKGRVAVVTGASKGIGRAIARGFAEEGVHLVLLARGKDALEEVAGQIRREQGVRVLALSADIRDDAAVKNVAEAAKAEFGTVHIVINNAGGPIKRQDRQITWPDSDWLDDLNLKTVGMLRVIQAFLPIMPRDWTGRVINVSGIASTSAFIGALTHGLNNAAMNQATSYLARDLAAEKITTNVIIPGLIATEWREGWAENMGRQQGKTKEQFLEDICKAWGIVQGRWGTVEEVADLTVFLASDRGAYINGARVAIDEAKRDPLDFVLWKRAKPNEPFWASPWGEGRPGWHIECSAMSYEILGSRFDIHGGGADLKFPHHENEIAQSCAATDDQFATYWMHNGFVNVDDEKMSKSLGNFFTIRDVLEQRIIEVGDSAPGFSVTTEKGQKISRSEFGGKLLVGIHVSGGEPDCASTGHHVARIQSKVHENLLHVATICVIRSSPWATTIFRWVPTRLTP